MRRIVIEIKKHSKVSLTPVQGERLDYAIKRYANHLRGLEPKQVLLQDYDPRVSSKYRYTPAPALLKVLKKALLDDQLSNRNGLAADNGLQPSAISPKPILKVRRKRRAKVVQQSATQPKEAEASKKAKEPAGRNKIQAAKSTPLSKPTAVSKTAKNNARLLPKATKSKVKTLTQAQTHAKSKEQTAIKGTRQQARNLSEVSKKKLRAAKPTKAVTPTPAKTTRGRPKPQPVASKAGQSARKRTNKRAKSQTPVVQPIKKPKAARGALANRSRPVQVEAKALAKTTPAVEKTKQSNRPKAMDGKAGQVKGQTGLAKDQPNKVAIKSKRGKTRKKHRAKAKV